MFNNIIFSNKMLKSKYTKMNAPNRTYLGYIVAIDNPLTYHIHIYWTEHTNELYEGRAKSYDYEYVSEELGEQVNKGIAYVCRLKDVACKKSEDFSTTRQAYHIASANIKNNNNFVLVNTGDIDTFSRILVDVYNVRTKENFSKILIDYTDPDGNKIAEKYVRPRNKIAKGSSPIMDFSPLSYNVE